MVENSRDDVWSKMSGGQKASIIGVGGIVLVALLFGVFFFSPTTNLVPLFSDLSSTDAAEIVEYLEASNIQYELKYGGSTILVPEKDVHRLRLTLSSQGIPRSGVVGFEIMDEVKMGSTDFDRKMSYLRALQGELTRTIRQINGVNDARVHIVLPEESVFISKSKPASAAVLLDIQPGVELDSSQVKGIVHLVARSVEGLDPEDVTVIDTNGRILSGDDGASQSSATAIKKIETQRDFEQQLENSVNSLLENIFGRGNVATRVNASLNMDERYIERQLFEPIVDGEEIVRSVYELQERFSSEGADDGGFVGSSSNLDIPTYPGTTGSSSASEYERIESTRNVELNEIREHIVVSPGAVERLSVAVVVNQELTEEEQQAVTNLVAASIGYDANREDVISIIGMPFDTTWLDDLKGAFDTDYVPIEEPKQEFPWVAVVVVGSLILLILVVSLILISSKRKKVDETTKLIKEIERLKAQQETSVGMDYDAQRGNPDWDRLTELAKRRPEEVAQLLRAWLMD